ncbi:hypothetical protein [Natrononativus amylolyticus]|uniref:hypothetical protein n=1 Tax=Natrononativus amylolyticus TaxID=2963434 RepID=UPI0020CDB414|nr:hypothetical protein [Natrononativus amylolyticus]
MEEQHDHYIPEKYQLGIITDYLQSHDFEFATEKRIFSYPIDVLAVKRGTTVAIEMKSKNVTRGVEQAHRDASLVDYAFLAVWEHNISEPLIERVSDLPIGLMSVGDRIHVLSGPIVEPQQLCDREIVIDLVINEVRNDAPVQKPQ